MNSKIGFSLFWGIFLIIIGILVILNQLSVISLFWKFIWPIFILVPGLIFEFSYFANPTLQNAGLLVPGGILIVIGILFFFSVFTDFVYMDILWPIFILAPAFGLFQLYLFGGRRRALLIPVFMLGFIGILFLLANTIGDFGRIVFPIVLIVLGLIIIYRGVRR